ncbi:MAG: DUF11 domain-containing protein [Planctomycetes bacterium]|nr:DUF11 domain-containing protein [Planctomycetota bacterium]
MAIGSHGTTSTTDQDWVIEGSGTSYSLLAKHSDPIYTGATELWSDVDGFSPTFFGVAMNSQGDYVIVGRTNNADLNKNVVAVFNGTTELFREGDPIDLDQNGQFDDDAFISNFNIAFADFCVLTDDGVFYVVINLRSTTTAFIGKALLQIDVASTPIPSVADIIVSKSVSDNSLESVGQQTTFTITVCNHGPLDATNVTMTDPLPAGLEFVTATNGATETSPGSNIVTASVATLASCDCSEYEVTVEASAEGVFNNTATAVATEPDPNGANNSASAAVTVVRLRDERRC